MIRSLVQIIEKQTINLHNMTFDWLLGVDYYHGKK